MFEKNKKNTGESNVVRLSYRDTCVGYLKTMKPITIGVVGQMRNSVKEYDHGYKNYCSIICACGCGCRFDLKRNNCGGTIKQHSGDIYNF